MRSKCANFNKLRRSQYIFNLYEQYVVNNPYCSRTPQNEGCGAQKYSFYSRLCGKIVQHIDSQRNVIGSGDFGRSNNFVYHGLIYVILINWNHIHHKHQLIILLKASRTLAAITHVNPQAKWLKPFLQKLLEFILYAQEPDYYNIYETQDKGLDALEICKFMESLKCNVGYYNEYLRRLIEACGKQKDIVKIAATLYWLKLSNFKLPEENILSLLTSKFTFLDVPVEETSLALRNLINFLSYMTQLAGSEPIDNLVANLIELCGQEGVNLNTRDLEQLNQIADSKFIQEGIKSQLLHLCSNFSSL